MSDGLAEVELIRRHYGDFAGLYDPSQAVAHVRILLGVLDSGLARLRAQVANDIAAELGASAKQCIVCRQIKQWDEFLRRSTARDGLDGRCKTCASARRQAVASTKAERACAVDGCVKLAGSKRHCSMHATRLYRTGSLDSPSLSPQERFFANVDAEGDCWLWTGRLGVGGYAYVGMRVDGTWKNLRAHRASYEMLVGPIPNGLQLDHLCRIRHCVNPDHLEPVTCKENVRRGFGVAAQLRQRTRCRNGHEFSPENTRVESGGSRRCLLCANASQQARRNERGARDVDAKSL